MLRYFAVNDDECLYGFSPFVIGNADDSNFGYDLMREENVFDFDRRNILAT